jgi:hypothetical protein
MQILERVDSHAFAVVLQQGVCARSTTLNGRWGCITHEAVSPTKGHHCRAVGTNISDDCNDEAASL